MFNDKYNNTFLKNILRVVDMLSHSDVSPATVVDTVNKNITTNIVCLTLNDQTGVYTERTLMHVTQYFHSTYYKRLCWHKCQFVACVIRLWPQRYSSPTHLQHSTILH